MNGRAAFPAAVSVHVNQRINRRRRDRCQILGFNVTASTLPTSSIALSRHPPLLSVIALAAMGAADTVSVRVALVQLSTPDAMRGRVGAVNFLFINASNQLGEFESGMAAALLGAMPAAALGGLGTIAIALLWMKLFPVLREADQLE